LKKDTQAKNISVDVSVRIVLAFPSWILSKKVAKK